MDSFLVIMICGIGLVGLAVLWWYYPYFRKPWMPKGRRGGRREPSREEGGGLKVKKATIVVYKGRRRMEVYEGEKLVRSYRVALGLNPVDDKRKEGDGCTPEGEFYVCTKNDRSKYHLFLGLSYPNREDAERGVESGLISEEEHKEIVDAIGEGKRPPWKTRLGGEIGIHGEGSGVDWTQGGIALDNEDMEELFMEVDMGTGVRILP